LAFFGDAGENNPIWSRTALVKILKNRDSSGLADPDYPNIVGFDCNFWGGFLAMDHDGAKEESEQGKGSFDKNPGGGFILRGC